MSSKIVVGTITIPPIVITPTVKRRLAGEAIDAKRSSLGILGAPLVPGDGGLIGSGDRYYRQYAHGAIAYIEPDIFVVFGSIGDKYVALGGPKSWLGWPTSDEQPFTQAGRVSTFENGAIYWWPDTGAIEMKNVAVRYRGLFCFGETNDQEGAFSTRDEPYAILGVCPTHPGLASSIRTPIYNKVDKGDSREENIELYRGLPYGLALGVVLMEHDLGDPDKYRSEVEIGVDQASSTVAAALVAVPGVGPALAVAAQMVLKEISPIITDAINGVLGTGDDLIGKLNWDVTAKNMVTMARAPHRNFNGIEFHMESPLIDEGDGAYKIYLDIQAV